MRRSLGRWALAGVAAAAGLGLGVAPPPGASAGDDPGVCGYVGYSVTGPTTTTTRFSEEECEWPCPSGMGEQIPPGHLGPVYWYVLVCITGV